MVLFTADWSSATCFRTGKGHGAHTLFHDGLPCEYNDDECWAGKLRGLMEKRSSKNKYRWFIPY